ncbi:MAG: ferritin family protein [Candidatus Scalindua sp.]|jgi:rubrerythrin|nr:ferritin family protein [Candidatus Scalindua sp.]
MDIYKYAMQMEVDGRDFYLDMMKKTNNKGLKNILTMMADSEAKHYNVILDMQKNDKTEFSVDTEVLTNVKNIFMKMKEEKDIDVDVSQAEFYKKALKTEADSRKFYLERADEEEDSHRKEIFLNLAEEERKHCVLLENMIGFVSQPADWLENPEWYHLDE